MSVTAEQRAQLERALEGLRAENPDRAGNFRLGESWVGFHEPGMPQACIVWCEIQPGKFPGLPLDEFYGAPE